MLERLQESRTHGQTRNPSPSLAWAPRRIDFDVNDPSLPQSHTSTPLKSKDTALPTYRYLYGAPKSAEISAGWIWNP